MSPKYKLDKQDGTKILHVFLYSSLSAVLAIVITLTQEIDFAQYAFLVPVINVMLYSAKKWSEGQ